MRSNLFWLSDEQWGKIRPLLPTDVRGKERQDDRRVISGILHVLKSGCRWCDCPPEYGPPRTIYNRFNRCSSTDRARPATVEPRRMPGRLRKEEFQIELAALPPKAAAFRLTSRSPGAAAFPKEVRLVLPRSRLGFLSDSQHLMLEPFVGTEGI